MELHLTNWEFDPDTDTTEAKKQVYVFYLSEENDRTVFSDGRTLSQVAADGSCPARSARAGRILTAR